AVRWGGDGPPFWSRTLRACSVMNSRPVDRYRGLTVGKQLCEAGSLANAAISSCYRSRRAIRNHHDGGQNQTDYFHRHVANRVACVAVDIERGNQVTQRVRGQDEYQKCNSRDHALPENRNTQHDEY